MTTSPPHPAVPKALEAYDAALANYRNQGITHEQATRLAFSTLLDTLSRGVGWTLVLEQTLANRKRPDGTLLDSFKIPRGYWEAKDTSDESKPRRAILVARDENAAQLSPDRTTVIANDSLTLAGLPPECFDYRLGNRSALEWIIDQYQVKPDTRSGLVSDPNRADDEEYIARLIGRVITVRVETVRIVEAVAAVDLEG